MNGAWRRHWRHESESSCGVAEGRDWWRKVRLRDVDNIQGWRRLQRIEVWSVPGCSFWLKLEGDQNGVEEGERGLPFLD
jgi:hypothetical protein